MKANFIVRTLAKASFWFDVHPRSRSVLAILSQSWPPLLFFVWVFGRWNPGVYAALFVIACYCLVRIGYLAFRRRFKRLLRPMLTIALAIAYYGLGTYYTNAAVTSLVNMATRLQSECRANGVCHVAGGEWVRDRAGPDKYWIEFPGAISLRARILLTLDDSHRLNCCTALRPLASKETPEAPFGPDMFVIGFPWEDGSVATGGVRKPLKIYNLHL